MRSLAWKICKSAYVTGDLVNDLETAELRKQTYPRDPAGYSYAADDKLILGRYRESIPDSQKELELFPGASIAVTNLCQAYLALNRLDEAKGVLDRDSRPELIRLRSLGGITP
jgi:tetratricopeptide (TPR) repeat protein